VADPSEMAGAVLYLANDASSYTTGVSLNVDCGFFLICRQLILIYFLTPKLPAMMPFGPTSPASQI
jgi:hypothetical protein